MPQAEFDLWRIRSQVIPFGWREREISTARILASQGVEEPFRDWTELTIEEDADFIANADAALAAHKLQEESNG